MMRKGVFLVVWVFGFASSFGQDGDNKASHYSIHAQYNHEFVLGGYVRVREWELAGDKMGLKQLGMTAYPALQLQIRKCIRKKRSVGVTFDYFFMNGNQTFDRDITYNGTIIDGRQGIDVSPTRYYRLTATFYGTLLHRPHFHLKYTVALAVDHVKFYLNGQVSPLSLKNEVYERFGRQAFPYPVLGVDGTLKLDKKSSLLFEVSGTYIPQFKSFYTEGGHVYLHYENFLAALNYSKKIDAFRAGVGVRFRYMHLFQESMEDTNILSTATGGPYLELSYQF